MDVESKESDGIQITNLCQCFFQRNIRELGFEVGLNPGSVQDYFSETGCNLYRVHD